MRGNRATDHYAYASNNPVSRIDPMGTQDFSTSWGELYKHDPEGFTRASDAAVQGLARGVKKGAVNLVVGVKDIGVGLYHGVGQLATDPGQHLSDLQTVASNAPGAIVDAYHETMAEIERDPSKVWELAGEAGFDVLSGIVGDRGMRKMLKVVRSKTTAPLKILENATPNGSGAWDDLVNNPLERNIDAWESGLHGNSLDAPGPHDVYVIRDQKTGRINHFGETGRGVDVRGDEWVKKLRKEYGLDTKVESLMTVEGKRAAKIVESRYIRTYEKIFGFKPGAEVDGRFIPIQKTGH